MKARLTAPMIEKLKAPKAGQIEWFDEILPAFGIRLSYDGCKSWFLIRRLHRKKVRFTLGRYPAVSLKDARLKATAYLECIERGEDPRLKLSAQKAEADARARDTFKLVADSFINKYAKVKLRPKTVLGYEFTLNKLCEGWHSWPIANVQRKHVIELIDDLEAQGKHATARLTLAYLKRFFAWCGERDILTIEPTHRVKVNSVATTRDRVLTEQELAQVWNASEKIGGPEGAIVKTFILTGQRRSETSLMKWSDLNDLDGSNPLWLIPKENSKNKRPHDVPLSPEAVQIIKSMPRFEGCPFVFTHGKTALNGFPKLKTRLDEKIGEEKEEGIAEWTYHDLRRTMATKMNDMGLARESVVEAILNHVSGHKRGVAGVYNRAAYLEERRKALNAWAQIVTQKITGSNIITLRAGA